MFWKSIERHQQSCWRLALVVVAGILLSAQSSHAQNTTGGAPPDLLFLNPSAMLSPPNLNVNAVSQTAAQTIDITKTNLIVIAAGQSNIADMAPSAYTPTNASSIFELNAYDGKFYPAVDPLIGPTQVPVGGTPEIGNPVLRAADSIITNAYFQRVYLVPIAILGTAVADWQTGPENPLIPVAVRRIKQKGVTCGGTNQTCVIIWGQGETDNTNGTSQSAYTNSLNAVIAAASAAGFVGHWYVAKQTYDGATSAAIQAAQAAVVNGTTVFAGPNADSLVGSVCGVGANAACRNSTDNVHWTDNGSFSYAALWVTALHTGGF